MKNEPTIIKPAPSRGQPADCASNTSSAASPCTTWICANLRRKCAASAADCSITTSRSGATPRANSAAVMTPVPPPSSTTRPGAAGSTHDAMRAASRGDEAQIAPTVPGCATSSRRNSDFGERLTARSTMRRTRSTLARAARTANAGPATSGRPRRTPRAASAGATGLRETRGLFKRMGESGTAAKKTKGDSLYRA